MKRYLLALAGLASLASATVANAQSATVSYGSLNAIPTPQNDFYSQLTSLGLNSYAAGTGTNVVLSAPATITFYFLGSESGYSDTFSTTNGLPNLTYTETSNIENHFGSPILLGSDTFAAGSLINSLLFSTSGLSSGGANARIGDQGFGVFLPGSAGPGAGSVSGLTTLYFGYDDQITRIADDNHDDFIVKAVISGVPEPTTWALMLLGFGAIGYSMRRKREASILPQVA